jgi:hypothetical protein
MEKITEKTNLSEILKNPKLVEILEKYNFPCMSCPFAKMEIENLEIGRVCQLYGIDAKKVVKELNDILKNEKRNS